MENLPNQLNQLILTNKIESPLGEKICKIDISGYSVDNFNTVNPEGYTILCNLGQASDGLTYFPKTSKIILNTAQQSRLINNLDNFDQFIPNIAKTCEISEQLALEKSADFFSNTEVIVQPIGIQGQAYKMMQSVQNIIPITYTHQAVSILKMTGMTGVQIISQSPLTFVGVTYIGALFFGYFGSVVGDNMVGLVFNSTSYVLSRPMWGVEVTLNGLIFRPISNRIGLPLILNGTQEMLAGKGLSVKEYTKIGFAFERISNSDFFKKSKKVYRIFFDKNE